MISSTSNPRVKNLIQLQKKSRTRREQQSFIAEGPKMVLETPDERLLAVYVSEGFCEDKRQWQSVQEKASRAGCPVEVLSDKVFREVSDTMTPQGVLAVVRTVFWDWRELLAEKAKGQRLFLILESLQDPGNFGTILRTGEGAGISGVILNRTSVEPYMPKAVRSTMGAIYRVPVAVADDLTEVVQIMQSEGMGVYAAHLKGEKNYWEQAYTADTCFMIGNEANGLTDTLTEMATDYIRIPMEGQVESLNAGVAAALLMYEAKRQRETKHP